MIKNYINGELLEPVSEKYFDNYDPAIGEAYGIVPDSDERDVELAVAAAEAAFPAWAATPPDERSRIMFKIAELIKRDLAEFARAECIDNGKPLTLAKTVDIPRAIKNFEFFASAIHGFASEAHQMDNEAVNYTLRNPVGIIGAISPWNLPLYLFTWKIAPALITGNCVIAKPSEITPMTAYLLSDACIEAGLPEGVLNIVHGYGHKVGRAITTHPKIKAITFTGGTKTGSDIASVAAPMFKKLSLELGGKNPNIIFADANYEKMLSTTVMSSFRNQGEICLCGSRVFVEKPIYDKFKNDFVERTKALKIGDPLQNDTDQGAIVSKEHMEKVLSYIKLAQDEGGTVLCGGNQFIPEGRCDNGWFIEPTIIEGLAYNCRTNQEEIFGPVVTITPFETEEEVLMMANSTEYGLASIIWTENISRAHRMAANIQTGIVWINCWMVRDLRTPFGGMKSSGIGREGGMEALRFFTELKNVCVKL
ncbi:MAG TPA: aldehyde dehydrogenase [Ignavibacteria bacterium]|nr:2-hydroxymuconic semialdehyde dehydrogenase [Bacteroidota bacterium]HRE10989.1 aldehyde dehydrogenase [Ignavibacteria bacterium]HCN37413.1 2-hydroxymuconic semialdehyde dehydrogenase [Bacteroidota bacterium]HRF65198.1 aldehyde dehydrogenase [Ignavibacteria bacterium]HRJ05438.1 aldehyde dehydrogenase [Ignavibacteria bacterium]